MAQLASVRALGAWGPGFESRLPDHFILNNILSTRWAGIMRLKLMYGLIYGFFGFIVAGLTAAVLYAVSTALLWTFAIGNGVWPHWLLFLLAFLAFLIFILLTIKMISLGFKKGQLLDGEDEEYKEENYVRAKWLLKISVLCLLVFISFLTFKYTKFNNQRKNMVNASSDAVNLLPIVLRQKDKLLEIVVPIKGKSQSSYSLMVEVIAVGKQAQPLVTIEKEIPVTYAHQEFVFPVSFDSLGERFHQYFIQYVPESDKKIGIDALLRIVVHLKVKQENEEQLPLSGNVEKKQETIARFFFSCMNKTCIVSQFDSREDIPTEKLKNQTNKN